MPWAKLDDRFQEHPKVRKAWSACPASVGLHVMAITYCAGNLTDGAVPAAWVESQFRRVRDEQAATSALVAAGLWAVGDDGWLIHDYLDHQDSKAKVVAKRQQNAENGKRGGRAKAKRPASDSPGVRQAVASDLSKPDTDTDTDTVSSNEETTDTEVVVVPPPPAVREEIERACDTLAAAGLHVHDRTTVERMADAHPKVDMEQAAINCAAWLRGGQRRVRHPLKALEPFVTADDAPQSRHLKVAEFAEYGEAS